MAKATETKISEKEGFGVMWADGRVPKATRGGANGGEK